MKESTIPPGVARRLTPLLAENGFTAVPALFLSYYHELKVSSSEAMLVIHLLSFKWDEKNPFPRVALIAERMGMTETAVRQHARSLEKKGLIQRIPRIGTSNEFDLTPLFAKLESILAEKQAETMSLILSHTMPRPHQLQN